MGPDFSPENGSVFVKLHLARCAIAATPPSRPTSSEFGCPGVREALASLGVRVCAKPSLGEFRRPGTARRRDLASLGVRAFLRRNASGVVRGRASCLARMFVCGSLKVKQVTC